MIKSVFAALSATALSAGAALAGPYVNVETNAGWTGDDYSGATVDIREWMNYDPYLGRATPHSVPPQPQEGQKNEENPTT